MANGDAEGTAKSSNGKKARKVESEDESEEGEDEFLDADDDESDDEDVDVDEDFKNALLAALQVSFLAVH